MANDGQLLRVGIGGGGVEVIEHDHNIPIGQRFRIRTLIEIAGVRAAGRVEEVAKEAERRGATDFFGR